MIKKFFYICLLSSVIPNAIADSSIGAYKNGKKLSYEGSSFWHETHGRMSATSEPVNTTINRCITKIYNNKTFEIDEFQTSDPFVIAQLHTDYHQFWWDYENAPNSKRYTNSIFKKREAFKQIKDLGISESAVMQCINNEGWINLP